MSDSSIRKSCPNTNECSIRIGFVILILSCICVSAVMVFLVGYGVAYLWNYIWPTNDSTVISCLSKIWHWDCIGYFWITGVDTIAIICFVAVIIFYVVKLVIYMYTQCCSSNNNQETLILSNY